MSRKECCVVVSYSVCVCCGKDFASSTLLCAHVHSGTRLRTYQITSSPAPRTDPPFSFSPPWPGETSHNLPYYCYAGGVVTSKSSSTSFPTSWATLRVTRSWTHNPSPIRINTEIWAAPQMHLNPAASPLAYWCVYAHCCGVVWGAGEAGGGFVTKKRKIL